MSIGILIADDQALVRAGFRMILEAEQDLRVLAEAKDGEEAVQAARRSQPEIVLMDIRMPKMDGLEATRRIIAASRQPPRVLMLTTLTSTSMCSTRSMPAPVGSCSRTSRRSSSWLGSASSPRATHCSPHRSPAG